MTLSIWLRTEHRQTEQRAPLTPQGARQLLESGAAITIESSSQRVFPDHDYAVVGCEITAAGSWTTAPSDVVVLGLKELPPEPAALAHTHIYFAHAYKEQAGWCELLNRFRAGHGRLLDIEYLTEPSGRRVAAFGYWAGYIGAALALMHWYGKLADTSASPLVPLRPYTDTAELDRAIDSLKQAHCSSHASPRALVIGALGRSGRGALILLENHGIKVTRWAREETRQLDRAALLSHDLFINCALIVERVSPFVSMDDLQDDERRLSVIADVSCDSASPVNPLPFYDEPTSWERPVVALPGARHNPCDLIAIDNLPSLLPRESSEDFAAQLLPFLLDLSRTGIQGVWAVSQSMFEQHVTRL